MNKLWCRVETQNVSFVYQDVKVICYCKEYFQYPGYSSVFVSIILIIRTLIFIVHCASSPNSLFNSRGLCTLSSFAELYICRVIDQT